MRYPDDTPAEHFLVTSDDWWTCVCGNDPQGFGLAPATYQGHPSDDDPTYDSHGTLVCLECGRYGTPNDEVTIDGKQMVRVKGRNDEIQTRAAWDARNG